jgi:rhodanese-related sulfurtransferase
LAALSIVPRCYTAAFSDGPPQAGFFCFGSTPNMTTYLEFASNHLLLVSGLLLSFFLVVFMELKRKAGGIINLEPTEVVKLLNADAVVIDLRSAEAFARGHIVNAKNIPHDELEANQDKIDKLKTKSIVAVCESGTTSSRVVAALRKAGNESVYGLRGGVNAWTQASLPLVTAKKTKSKSKS